MNTPDQFLDSVYTELHAIARRYMRAEREDHTLQPTALLNEAWMRLYPDGQHGPECESKTHFLALAARQMRRILVDHSRRRNSVKRMHGVKVAMDGVDVPGRVDIDAAAIDGLIQTLEQKDPRAAQVVELKFFGGLTDAQTAEVLAVSTGTVRRDWEFARAWLFQHLKP